MFNKVSVKQLSIVFFALLVLFSIDFMIGDEAKNSSFNSQLVSFDSVNVTQIVVHPKGMGDAVTFKKQGDRWQVSDNNGNYNADGSQIKTMLSSVMQLKAKRLASKSKEKWAKYELTDSMSIRVEFRDAEKTLTDLYIGKFSYSQPPMQRGQNPYMQRQQGIMTSYVRLGESEDVYAVDGFLSMTFGRKSYDYRDSRILHMDKNNIAKISFSLPNEDFQLIKKDSVWLANGLLADSASIEDFFSNNCYARTSDYVDAKGENQAKPSHSVSFENNQGQLLAKVDAFYKDSTNVLITSSINPGTYFDGITSGVFQKLFKSENSFIKAEQ